MRTIFQYRLFLLFSFTFFIFIVTRGQSFVDINAGLQGISNSSVAWGDYDNDMDMDVLISGEISGGAAITKLYNNDQGTFNEVVSDFVGLRNGSVQWGDYDNDGDLDILATGDNSEGSTFIYKNENNEFIDINPGIEYFGDYSSAYWGDYDNDGDLDVFITGGWNSKLYRNDGQDNFVDSENEFMALSSSRASWGDYDNDRDMDLLVTGDTGGGMKLYCYKNTDGVFEEIEFANMGLASGSVEWGDYDSDGDLDILIMGFDDYIEPKANIFRNDGNHIFHNIYSGLPPVTLGTASWGDVDNDGDLDVLITGKLAGCGVFASSIHKNMGNDIFNDISAGLESAERSAAAWSDFDNDTDLDLILTGSNYSGSKFTNIYRNDMSLPNIMPIAPDNLSFGFNDNEVILSWDPGYDAQTPENGLSYNIRIGTSPQEYDNMSPMSHIENGFRKINAFGNIGQSTSWKINELEPGITYYWSVQTIDNTFQASEFSDEQSFYLTYTEINKNFYDEPHVTFHPNPAKNHIYFKTPGVVVNSISAEIYSLTGEKIKPLQVMNTERINISELKKGVYLVRTNLNGNQYTERLIVK